MRCPPVDTISGCPRTEALKHGFHIHELGHAHWSAHNDTKSPVALPPSVGDWRSARPSQVIGRDTV
jgi:hypothetical protein